MNYLQFLKGKTKEKAKLHKTYVVMFSIGTFIDIQCCTRFLQYLVMFKYYETYNLVEPA